MSGIFSVQTREMTAMNLTLSFQLKVYSYYLRFNSVPYALPWDSTACVKCDFLIVVLRNSLTHTDMLTHTHFHWYAGCNLTSILLRKPPTCLRRMMRH